MKKIIPFIFPVIALVIVVGLMYRWYVLRTNHAGQIPDRASSIEVQDLSSSDQARLAQPAKDLKTQELQAPVATTSGQKVTTIDRASVRYEIVQGKLNFSLSADLPALKTGVYQVWIKHQDTVSKAFNLEAGKGGWIGSGSVNSELLPLDILVTEETQNDNQMEKVLLQTSIQPGQ